MTASTNGTATPTTPVIGFGCSGEVLASPTIERDLKEKTRKWHVDTAKEVKEPVPGPLAFNIPNTRTIKLFIGGLENQKDVAALRFGFNGKDIQPSIAALDSGWLIQFVTEASGKFTIST